MPPSVIKERITAALLECLGSAVIMYSARPALLTTVRQPFERIGQRAAEILLRRLGPLPSPSTFQHVLLPTMLVERSTCQALEKST